MPADSPVFDATCEQLEKRTALDRLEVRGTVRLGLKAAGLDVSSVDAAQMVVMLRKVLPKELETRGIDGAEALCADLVGTIEGIAFDGTDRAEAAATAMSRFGS